MGDSRERYLHMAPENRIDLVNSIHISTNESNRIIKAIENCHKSYHRMGEPSNVFIYGVTGIGKTTICKQYSKRFRRVASDADDHVRVLYLKVPSPATVKGMASKMLYALGDPKAYKGNTDSITNRLKKFLVKCRVEIVIKDEFQHMTDNKSDNAIGQASNWLKLLIEETNIPFVLIGLEESLAIFELNPQLRRRFSHSINVKPFNFIDKNDRKYFKKFLNTFDKLLPFPEYSKLGYGDMPERFYFLSDGVIAYIVKLLRFSAEKAIELDLPNIDTSVLEQVYDEKISFGMPGKSNPFSFDHFSLDYELVTNNNTHQNSGMNNRIRAKKKNDNIADIFRK